MTFNGVYQMWYLKVGRGVEDMHRPILTKFKSYVVWCYLFWLTSRFWPDSYSPKPTPARMKNCRIFISFKFHTIWKLLSSDFDKKILICKIEKEVTNSGPIPNLNFVKFGLRISLHPPHPLSNITTGTPHSWIWSVLPYR